MPAGWMLAIVLASDQNHLPGPDGIPFFDKFAHFGAFGLLGTLWAHALHRPDRPWRAAVLTVGLVSFFGASDEFHQSFRPGRSVELADWIADTLGASVAVALYCFWPAYRKLMERPLVRRRQEPRAPAAIAATSPETNP